MSSIPVNNINSFSIQQENVQCTVDSQNIFKMLNQRSETGIFQVNKFQCQSIKSNQYFRESHIYKNPENAMHIHDFILDGDYLIVCYSKAKEFDEDQINHQEIAKDRYSVNIIDIHTKKKVAAVYFDFLGETKIIKLSGNYLALSYRDRLSYGICFLDLKEKKSQKLPDLEKNNYMNTSSNHHIYRNSFQSSGLFTKFFSIKQYSLDGTDSTVLERCLTSSDCEIYSSDQFLVGISGDKTCLYLTDLRTNEDAKQIFLDKLVDPDDNGFISLGMPMKKNMVHSVFINNNHLFLGLYQVIRPLTIGMQDARISDIKNYVLAIDLTKTEVIYKYLIPDDIDKNVEYPGVEKTKHVIFKLLSAQSWVAFATASGFLGVTNLLGKTYILSEKPSFPRMRAGDESNDIFEWAISDDILVTLFCKDGENLFKIVFWDLLTRQKLNEELKLWDVPYDTKKFKVEFKFNNGELILVFRDMNNDIIIYHQNIYKKEEPKSDDNKMVDE